MTGSSTASRPTMLSFVRDLANVVTLLGLALGMVGLAAVLAGELELAVALGIWAMICDSIDGPIARRSSRRTDHHRTFGVQLDSLADIVCSTVLPAALLTVLYDQSPVTLVGVLLVLSGAVRLAYFNMFGQVGGAFVGLPVAYTPLLVAPPFLVSHDFAKVVILPTLAVVAVLQVLPVRVPEVAGRPLLALLVFSAVLSVVVLL